MKKNVLKNSLLILFAFLICFTLSACSLNFGGDTSSSNNTSSSSTTSKTLSNIYFTSQITTSYLINEKLNLNGSKLRLVYDDSSSEEVNITTDMITGFSTATVGERTLTLTYNGKSLTSDYRVDSFKFGSFLIDKQVYYYNGILVDTLFATDTTKTIKIELLSNYKLNLYSRSSSTSPWVADNGTSLPADSKWKYTTDNSLQVYSPTNSNTSAVIEVSSTSEIGLKIIGSTTQTSPNGKTYDSTTMFFDYITET
jgi:hypothetical protein